MPPASRTLSSPGRSLWLVWALLLACLFPGCEGGHNRLSFAVPGEDLNVVRGRVYDIKSGRDLTGATVKLIPEGQTVVTSATGTYRITQATPGSHRLEVSRPGFNTRVQGVLLAHRGTLALDVGLMPDSFSGTISGLVLDAATDAPLAGVRVTVPEQRSTVPLPGGAPMPVSTGVTGADGRFQLGPVGAGQVTVVFESGTHRPTVVTLDVPAGGNADLVFRLLLSTGTLAGTVRSSLDSNPLAGAQVSILSSPTAVLTDAQGGYRLGPLFAGSYAVEYTATGHDRLEITTAVLPGRTTIANVTLRFNLARLMGTVSDASGQPLASAVVSVPGLNVTSRTDANGRYDFGLTLRIPFPVLPISVGASAQGLQPAAGLVSILPGQTVVQDFTLVASSGNLIGQWDPLESTCRHASLSIL